MKISFVTVVKSNSTIRNKRSDSKKNCEQMCRKHNWLVNGIAYVFIIILILNIIYSYHHLNSFSIILIRIQRNSIDLSSFHLI